MKLFCLVPIFQAPPDLDERLAAIGLRPGRVVLVDDGSPVAHSSADYTVLRHDTNRGIAAALNTGLEWCRQHGATHVLTLDQDTTLPAGYVSRMRELWAQAEREGLRPGVLAAGYFGDGRYSRKEIHRLTPLDEVLQSGSIFDLEALREIGDFDESLVIDAVDTDACLRIRATGREVLATPERIDHAPGRTRHYRLFGWEIASTNHLPFRRYYIVRNRLRLLARFGVFQPMWALRTSRRLAIGVLLSLTSEQRRMDNALATGLGIVDCLRRRWGPLPEAVRRRWG